MAQKKRPANVRKKKRRRKRFMKKMLATLCVLAVLTFVISLIYTVFQVKKITVTGNQYTSSQDVTEWIQKDRFADNSLYIFFKYNMDNVKQLPSVESVTVKLETPWVLKVTVHEKTLAGRIDFGSDFLYFDANGIASLITSERLEEIPYIEGVELNMEEVKLGEEIPAQNVEIYQQTSEVSGYLSEQGLSPDRIVYEDNGITLYFDDIRVMLGNDDFEDKLKQIPPILKELEEEYEGMTGVLHLENYENGSTTVRFVPDTVSEEDEIDDEMAYEDGTSDTTE